MRKDTLEHAREPNFDLKSYLADSYLHPVFKSDDVDKFYVADDPGAEEVIDLKVQNEALNSFINSCTNMAFLE